MADVYKSKYECTEIEEILETQAQLAEYRAEFPSETLLELAASWFKDTDDISYADVLCEAEIMDVANIGTNGFYPVRIRYRILNGYFLCQKGVRMQYASALSGSRMSRCCVDVVVPLSLSSGATSLAEKYYFETANLLEELCEKYPSETLLEMLSYWFTQYKDSSISITSVEIMDATDKSARLRFIVNTGPPFCSACIKYCTESDNGYMQFVAPIALDETNYGRAVFDLVVPLVGGDFKELYYKYKLECLYLNQVL